MDTIIAWCDYTLNLVVCKVVIIIVIIFVFMVIIMVSLSLQ